MWPLIIATLISAPTPTQESLAPDAKAIAALAAGTAAPVRSAFAKIDAAAAKTRALDQRFWPQVTATARYTRLSYNEPTRFTPAGVPVTVEIPGAVANQFAVGVGVALPLSDWLLRWDDAKAAGKHAEAAERALADAARQKAAADAVALWYEWQRATLGSEVATASLTNAEAHLAAAVTLQKAEVASLGDVRLAEAGVAAAKLMLARTHHGAEQARLALATMLHREAAEIAPVASTESVWPSETVVVRDALIARALAARPEAQAIAAGETALALRADVAEVDRYPRLDVVAQAQLANPSPRGLQNEDEFVGVWDASAVLTWRLSGLWETDTALASIAAERLALAADRQALEDGIRFEVDLALRMLADADSATEASRAMLAAAEEGHRIRARAYAVGKASSVDLSEAEAELTRARLSSVDATIDRRLGELRLAHALGVRLTD